MVKFLANVFRDRSLSPWERLVKQAERAVYKERDGQTAPPFEPQDGVYEYTRVFDAGRCRRKGSCYHATIRLSFSPAPDYGWQITGVGSERIRVLGVEGGEPRRFCIDDGRVTSSGKFYWTETRYKLQHLVTGSLEPHYCAVDGRLQRDPEANFRAYLTVSSSLDAKGNAQRQELQSFVCQKDLQGQALDGSSSTNFTKKKQRSLSSSKKQVDKSAIPATNGNNPDLTPLLDDSLTEDNTEFQEKGSVTSDSA